MPILDNTGFDASSSATSNQAVIEKRPGCQDELAFTAMKEEQTITPVSSVISTFSGHPVEIPDRYEDWSMPLKPGRSNRMDLTVDTVDSHSTPRHKEDLWAPESLHPDIS